MLLWNFMVMFIVAKRLIATQFLYSGGVATLNDMTWHTHHISRNQRHVAYLNFILKKSDTGHGN